MNLKTITPEKIAVVETIFKIRNKRGPTEDYFTLSVKDGLRELQTNGKAIKYGIGYPEYIKIIQELSRDLIEADWITGEEESNGIARKAFAYHDEKWIGEKYHEYLTMFVFDDEVTEGYFFVHLDYKTIKTISDNCIARYSCTLCYDDSQYCFYVKCKETGEEYIIRRLKNGLMPFEVLLFAFQSRHKHASRVGLNKSGREVLYVGKKSILSRVYDENSVVRNALSPFVRLDKDNIQVFPKARLTEAQLNAIKNA